MDEIRYWIETEGTGHWFFLAFPAILLCLLIWFKGRRARFLIPSLIISIVIINPWFYEKWTNLGLYAYWRILWIVPVIPVIASIVPSVTERIQNSRLKGIAVAFGIGLAMLGGSFLYNGAGGSFVEAANAAKLPEDIVEIADRLLELDENPRVIAQAPLGVYLRQYSGNIDTLYGRDIYGYIYNPTIEARTIHNEISNGELESVAQFMADDGYGYLIINGSTRESFELVEHVSNYEIYKTIAKPDVVIERDDFGREISITIVNEDGKSIIGELGYATICYEYDKFGNVVKESYLDEYGHQCLVLAGYSAVEMEWDGEKIKSRIYLGFDGIPINRSDGYYKAVWEDNNLRLYNLDGIEVYGKNLVRDIKTNLDGWSSWITPRRDEENVCYNIGYINLDDSKTGDSYTCQIELEFRNVSAIDGQPFWIRAQGPVDGAWSIKNIWGNELISITTPPEDGVYFYTATIDMNDVMAKAKNFVIGFRCDYWKEGSFRFRKVQIEKGNKASEWVPGESH